MTDQATTLQPLQINSDQITPWLKQSFEIFKKFPGVFILFIVIEIIMGLAVAYVPIVGAPASFILSPLFFAGWLLALKKIENGSEIEIADLFLGFKTEYFLPVLFIALAITLIMVAIAAPIVIAAIFMGVTNVLTQSSPNAFYLVAIFAMVVSGVLAYGLYLMIGAFSVQLVVLDKVETFAAIKLSFLACWENVWPLTLYGFITLGLSFACIFTLGLGFFILAPVLRIASYLMYKGIFKNASPTQI